MPQEVFLFSDTISNNISFSTSISDDNVEAVSRAARNAQVVSNIESFPKGYETKVGERGITLSGGQKQRLALARALLVDPPILILDEATAMFDPEGEKGFIAECYELLSQRTVVLITHRPESLKLADYTYKLNKDATLES